MIAYDEQRYHTRINITPSSMHPEFSFTIGNLYMLRLNAQMALSSGGTLTFQFEDVLTQNTSIGYRGADRRPFGDAILRLAAHYGIRPSTPEVLESFDIPGKYSVQYQSETAMAFEAVWKLLPFREHLPPPWNTWPTPLVEHAHFNLAITDMPGIPNGLQGHRGAPVGLIVYRVVDDMLAGRNYFINGTDCQHYRSLYNTICVMLRIPPPLQLTAPLLHRRRANGKVDPIHTSDVQPTDSWPEEHNPYHVHYAAAAGLTYHELWGFIMKAISRSPAADSGSWPGVVRWNQTLIDRSLRPCPTVDDAEWIELLSMANARRKKVVNAELAEAKQVRKAAEEEQERAEAEAEIAEKEVEITERIQSEAKALAEVMVEAEMKRLERNRKRRERYARERSEK